MGVTGQKRSWVQQKHGYAEIIKKLADQFEYLTVYVDGMTASYDKKIKVEEDLEVYESIKRIVQSERDSVEFHCLIGDDYKTKIRCCEKVDVFVANAGSGCIVPLRFNKKHGVLHSNGRLRTFGEDDYHGRVLEVENKSVVLKPDSDKESASLVSYGIDWRYIYDLLATKIENVRGTTLSRNQIGADKSSNRFSDTFEKALF